jgi:hypothetical protein
LAASYAGEPPGHSRQFDLDDVLPKVEREIGTVLRAGSVIDHNVQAAIRPVRERDEFAYFAFVSHVGTPVERSSSDRSDRCDGLGAPVVVDVGDDDQAAIAGDALGDSSPGAASTRSGNNCDFALEFHSSKACPTARDPRKASMQERRAKACYDLTR